MSIYEVVTHYLQLGVLVTLVVLGVLHLGLKAREGGKSFTTYVMLLYLVGMYSLQELMDPESDPRREFSILLAGVIILNVAVMVYLRIRRKKISVSNPEQFGNSP